MFNLVFETQGFFFVSINPAGNLISYPRKYSFLLKSSIDPGSEENIGRSFALINLINILH